MTTSTAEQRIQRRLTEAFIGADYTDVAMNRPTMVESDAGGKEKSEPETLSTQRVKLGAWGGGLSMNELGGYSRENLVALIGEHDLDVALGDWFVHEAEVLEVVWIDPKRDIRTVCAMARKGRLLGAIPLPPVVEESARIRFF